MIFLLLSLYNVKVKVLVYYQHSIPNAFKYNTFLYKSSTIRFVYLFNKQVQF